MTAGEALRAAGARLESVGGSGRLDAALLLAHATGRERAAFLAAPEAPLADAEAAAFAALVERRAAGVPVAYLIGSAGFFGRTFAVDERVLVPRPETEHLVEATLAHLAARVGAAPRIADIGTGSGAIAVALAGACPDAWVFATDRSRDAIAVARSNAARNNVFQQCTFLAGDLAAPLARFAPFDAIVANLPYVPTGDLPRPPDPAAHEPPAALDGGPDGLDCYRRLLPQLPALLAPGAAVFLEAAPPTIAGLAALGRAAFAGAEVAIGRDYAGLERYVTVRV